jgi:DNA modification methylase
MSGSKRVQQIAAKASAPEPKLKVDYISPDLLRPSPRNARLHSPKKIRQLSQSIKALKVIAPILVDEDLEILAGHARWGAAKLLGLREIPIIQVKYLSEAEKRAYRLADNRFSEKATWDNELLSIELSELIDLEFAVELTGFDTADIDIILTGADENLAEDELVPPKELGPATTRIGDIYQLGEHRLICGDARDPTAYKTLMAGEKARMVIADPPYNLKIEGHVSGLGRVRHLDFTVGSGEFTFEQFVLFLRTAFILLVSHTVDGAIHFVFMDWRHTREISEASEGVYSELKNLVVWNKGSGGLGSFYRSQHELIFAYKSGKRAHINNFELGQHGRCRTNVWHYSGQNSFRKGRLEELALHPTVKPIQLVADAIMDVSNRKDIVLDPFAGSGTTLIAAERTGRRARLIELDPTYCDVIIRRWLSLSGTTAIHVSTGLSFDELTKTRQLSASEGASDGHTQKHRRRT